MPDHLAAISCPNNCEHDVSLLFQPVLQYADVSTFRRGFSQIQRKIDDNELFRYLYFELTTEFGTIALHFFFIRTSKF